MTRVLAVDQATRTGWAVGDGHSFEQRAVEFGRFKMPDRDAQGERFRLFRQAIIERVEFYKVDLIAAEEPYWPPPFSLTDKAVSDALFESRVMLRGDQWHDAGKAIRARLESKAFRTSADVQKFLQRLYGVLSETAADLRLPLETYSPMTWRKTALGHGFPTDPKKAMRLKARQLGYEVEVDDESDAIGILMHALHGAAANARAQIDLLETAKARL